jgi:TAK1-binding protein 1
LGTFFSSGLLIDNSRLFVANVGDTQAVVARQLPDGQLKAIPLTVDHVLDNEDEMLRLSHLGLDPAKMMGALAPQGYTRCLGCHR